MESSISVSYIPEGNIRGAGQISIPVRAYILLLLLHTIFQIFLMPQRQTSSSCLILTSILMKMIEKRFRDCYPLSLKAGSRIDDNSRSKIFSKNRKVSLAFSIASASSASLKQYCSNSSLKFRQSFRFSLSPLKKF